MRFCWLLTLTMVLALPLGAQNRPKSPRGQAAVEVGSGWIEVDYGRPILRGRQGIFGEGDTYGKKVSAGAPVWRVGANQSTRLMTEVDLQFGEEVVPPGEYSLFVELNSPEQWTLILSEWGAQQQFDRNDSDNLWGAYGYTDEKDVVRATMTVTRTDESIEQFTILFSDCSENGCSLVLWWDTSRASVAFQTP